MLWRSREEVMHSGGRRCLQLMAAGQADLGTAAETAIAFEAFERTDFSVIASFSSTASDVELVARRVAAIRHAGPGWQAGRRRQSRRGAVASSGAAGQ